jgi:hypothetical protein
MRTLETTLNTQRRIYFWYDPRLHVTGDREIVATRWERLFRGEHLRLGPFRIPSWAKEFSMVFTKKKKKKRDAPVQKGKREDGDR